MEGAAGEWGEQRAGGGEAMGEWAVKTKPVAHFSSPWDPQHSLTGPERPGPKLDPPLF